MNTLHCQNLQARLLEMKAGGLSEAERVHLGQCPACREFAQDVSAPGAALTAVAQQLQRQSPITLPAGLKNSVLQKMSPKLAAEERAAAPTPQAAEAGRNTPQRERDWSELLGTVLGQWRWRWAAACAALACIAIVVLNTLDQRPIGRLEFVNGLISLVSDSMARHHEGVGNWEYKRGATLETDGNSSARFKIGEEVFAAIASNTKIQIHNKQSLALNKGSVWLSVTPGGKGFRVETPFGLVRVTGTQFGVTVTARQTLVEVREGSVEVSQAQGLGRVTQGKVLTADASGISAASPRPEGTDYPGWVNSLKASADKAYSGNYLPSIGKRP